MRSPRSFLSTFLLATIAGVGIVCCGNIILDTSGVYNSRSNAARQFSKSFSEQLLHSKNGLIFVGRERQIKIDLVRSGSGDCFVTGSSRQLGAGSTTLSSLSSCHRALNLAVSGGTLEDAFIFAIEAARQSATRRIIFGLDPWMFRRNLGAGWIEFAEEYAAALVAIGIKERASAALFDEGVLQRAQNVLNLRYFFQSLKSWLANGRLGHPEIVLVADDHGNVLADRAILLPDGRQLPTALELAKSPPQDLTVADGGYRIEAPLYNSNVVREFEFLLRHLSANKIDVEFLLIPYHPKVWQCRNASICNSISDFENIVREISSRHGIRVIGGYRPELFEFTRSDFIDALHVQGTALKKLTFKSTGITK